MPWQPSQQRAVSSSGCQSLKHWTLGVFADQELDLSQQFVEDCMQALTISRSGRTCLELQATQFTCLQSIICAARANHTPSSRQSRTCILATGTSCCLDSPEYSEIARWNRVLASSTPMINYRAPSATLALEPLGSRAQSDT